MIELVRTNDAVIISFICSLLKDAGIDPKKLYITGGGASQTAINPTPIPPTFATHDLVHPGRD